MKEKLSKLVNVYKKYGFIGFCKKLRAYIIANYLDKISFKVIFNKRKYSKIIKKILDNEVLPNKLILSSHKNVSDLREYMFKIGYKIEKEIIVYENNIYYNIIKYVKEKDNLSKYDLLVGLSNDINYKKHLLNKYKEIYEKSHDKKYLEYINIIKRKQD